jgi:hypothetical protein
VRVVVVTVVVAARVVVVTVVDARVVVVTVVVAVVAARVVLVTVVDARVVDATVVGGLIVVMEMQAQSSQPLASRKTRFSASSLQLHSRAGGQVVPVVEARVVDARVVEVAVVDARVVDDAVVDPRVVDATVVDGCMVVMEMQAQSSQPFASNDTRTSASSLQLHSRAGGHVEPVVAARVVDAVDGLRDVVVGGLIVVMDLQPHSAQPLASA